MAWSDETRAKALATRRANAAKRKEITANEIDLDMIPDKPRKSKRKQRRSGKDQVMLQLYLKGKKYVLPVDAGRELYLILATVYGSK